MTDTGFDCRAPFKEPREPSTDMSASLFISM